MMLAASSSNCRREPGTQKENRSNTTRGRLIATTLPAAKNAKLVFYCHNTH